MYLLQIVYYCFSRATSAAVKQRIYVQRQLLSCVTQKTIWSAVDLWRLASCRDMFLLWSEIISPPRFTLQILVITQIAATLERLCVTHRAHAQRNISSKCRNSTTAAVMRGSCIFTSSWFVFYCYVVIWKQNRWNYATCEFFVRRLMLLFQMRVSRNDIKFLIYPANNDNTDRYCVHNKNMRTIVYISRAWSSI